MYFFKKKKKKRKIENSNNYLSNLQFGLYGIKSETSGILTVKQLEASRRVIVRETKRICKVKIRVFFHQPITKKPLLLRMGRGCGIVKNWIFYVKKGLILLETTKVDHNLVFGAFKKASFKLPVIISFICREFYLLKKKSPKSY